MSKLPYTHDRGGAAVVVEASETVSDVAVFAVRVAHHGDGAARVWVLKGDGDRRFDAALAGVSQIEPDVRRVVPGEVNFREFPGIGHNIGLQAPISTR